MRIPVGKGRWRKVPLIRLQLRSTNSICLIIIVFWELASKNSTRRRLTLQSRFKRSFGAFWREKCCKTAWRRSIKNCSKNWHSWSHSLYQNIAVISAKRRKKTYSRGKESWFSNREFSNTRTIEIMKKIPRKKKRLIEPFIATTNPYTLMMKSAATLSPVKMKILTRTHLTIISSSKPTKSTLTAGRALFNNSSPRTSLAELAIHNLFLKNLPKLLRTLTLKSSSVRLKKNRTEKG